MLHEYGVWRKLVYDTLHHFSASKADGTGTIPYSLSVAFIVTVRSCDLGQG